MLCHKEIKPALVAAMKAKLIQMYGKQPQNSESYGRIVNEHHWGRIAGLVKESDGLVVLGGLDGTESQPDKYFPPTLIEDVSLSSPLMKVLELSADVPLMIQCCIGRDLWTCATDSSHR